MPFRKQNSKSAEIDPDFRYPLRPEGGLMLSHELPNCMPDDGSDLPPYGSPADSPLKTVGNQLDDLNQQS